MSQQPPPNNPPIAPRPRLPEATLSYAPADLDQPVRVRDIGIAQRQLLRALLIAIGVVVIGVVAPGLLPPKIASPFGLMTWCGPAVLMMVRMCQLSVAMGYGLTRRVLYTAGMLLPWINLLVVLSAVRDATRALQRAGIRVGLMGARISDLP